MVYYFFFLIDMYKFKITDIFDPHLGLLPTNADKMIRMELRLLTLWLS